MAASLNRVMLIGRLGIDPELRYTQGGQAVANFRMATDESYFDKNTNQKVEKCEWHSVVVWGKQAEPVANYLHKGSQAYVEGSLQTRQWEDQNGQTRYTTEIKAQRVQFLDPKGQGQPQQERPAQGQQGGTNQPPRFPTDADDMQDVPF